MKYYLGIDAGSSYIKMLIIDPEGFTVGKSVIPRGSNIDGSCCSGFRELLHANKIDEADVNGIASTGYGRRQVSFAEEVITEITAVSIGGYYIDHDVRTIIDVGGQDSKVMAIDESGHVMDFVMNHKCSAGTGKFLDVTSGSLGVQVEELGQLSQKSDATLHITSTCTVFAESEIVSHVANGEKKENIIKALHVAISNQVMGLYRQVNSSCAGKIMFVGGVALNKGVCLELSNMLKNDVAVPLCPNYVGALGAALFVKRIKER